MNRLMKSLYDIFIIDHGKRHINVFDIICEHAPPFLTQSTTGKRDIHMGKHQRKVCILFNGISAGRLRGDAAGRDPGSPRIFKKAFGAAMRGRRLDEKV